MLYVRKHFRTITRHRHQVIRLCGKCGILWQGLRHDLSKYTPTEFLEGIRYYQGYRSPNVGAREANGFSRAWMHHQGRNRHHFEYRNDYNYKTRLKEPVRMPTRATVRVFLTTRALWRHSRCFRLTAATNPTTAIRISSSWAT